MFVVVLGWGYESAHVLCSAKDVGVAPLYSAPLPLPTHLPAPPQALSHNFSVRDSAVFHLVKAKVLRSQGEPEEALRVLETAMALRSVRSAEEGGGLSSFDRCSVFLLTAEVMLELKKLKEAREVVQKAAYEFNSTTQVDGMEGRWRGVGWWG